MKAGRVLDVENIPPYPYGQDTRVFDMSIEELERELFLTESTESDWAFFSSAEYNARVSKEQMFVSLNNRVVTNEEVDIHLIWDFDGTWAYDGWCTEC